VTFESFQLDARVMAGVQKLGFDTPTPIQEQAIPIVLQGKDVMGLAQTGTGKTAAFALPILQRLLQGPRGKVRALILAPTRELAEQIHEQFLELGSGMRPKSVTVYGGVSMERQIQALRRGAEIVVACPGRLLDHMQQRTIDLSGVEVLVLDEADRMFDMGFLPDIRRVVRHLPAKRQTLLFSATMPQEIAKLAHEVLRNPTRVEVKHTVPLTTVSHAIYPVEQHAKSQLLVQLLGKIDTDSVLVFTRTKHRTERLAKQLNSLGYGCASLQGNLSQNRRQAALDGFRSGKFKILVATDIAARGIDISSISHVVNFDIPDTVEAYTHRIGRTGRAARTGDAYTLVSGEDAPMVRDIEKALGRPIERRYVDGFDYKMPKQVARRAEKAAMPRENRPDPRRRGGPRDGRVIQKIYNTRVRGEDGAELPPRSPHRDGDRGDRRPHAPAERARPIAAAASAAGEGPRQPRQTAWRTPRRRR
jgi:ATP-dependent RNA helicase RhlE